MNAGIRRSCWLYLLRLPTYAPFKSCFSNLSSNSWKLLLSSLWYSRLPPDKHMHRFLQLKAVRSRKTLSDFQKTLSRYYWRVQKTCSLLSATGVRFLVISEFSGAAPMGWKSLESSFKPIIITNLLRGLFSSRFSDFFSSQEEVSHFPTHTVPDMHWQ